MHRKDVQRLERRRVVAAKHVLISQQVGKVSRECIAYALILGFGYQTTTQLQPEQLTWIEHVPITSITPSMQPVGFISRWNFLPRHKPGCELLPSLGSALHARIILGIGLLEKTTLVFRLPFRVVVFDGKKAVLKGAPPFSGIDVGMSAPRATAMSPPGGAQRGKVRFRMWHNRWGICNPRPR